MSGVTHARSSPRLIGGDIVNRSVRESEGVNDYTGRLPRKGGNTAFEFLYARSNAKRQLRCFRVVSASVSGDTAFELGEPRFNSSSYFSCFGHVVVPARQSRLPSVENDNDTSCRVHHMFFHS